MIVCRYVSNTETSVTYNYGGWTKDITGIITFHFTENAYEIIKEPIQDEVKVYDVYIQRLYRKYMARFQNGEFPEKLSYIS